MLCPPVNIKLQTTYYLVEHANLGVYALRHNRPLREEHTLLLVLQNTCIFLLELITIQSGPDVQGCSSYLPDGCYTIVLSSSHNNNYL